MGTRFITNDGKSNDDATRTSAITPAVISGALSALAEPLRSGIAVIVLPSRLACTFAVRIHDASHYSAARFITFTSRFDRIRAARTLHFPAVHDCFLSQQLD